MKKILFSIALFAISSQFLMAQSNYPEPEFSNEVYLLRISADSSHELMRLEKAASQTDNKLKLGGFGGLEISYLLEGEASSARLVSETNLSFVFSKSGIDSVTKGTVVDAVLHVIGVGAGDPARFINLYKTILENGKRKIIIQKRTGLFGNKKKAASEKYGLSVKKIREGYWELITENILPKGEYVFALTGNPDGAVSLFAFGVD
ncbi:MAG: hypothetical protein H7Y01_03045 [Ferruginibacter sp.]|nr:hypothetical protein [Chitinophagaceae bacterium]